MLNLPNIYQPGTFVTIKGISGEPHWNWTILTVHIVLRESDNALNTHEMVQMLTLLAVDAEGNMLDKEPITVNSDMFDIVEH